MRRKSVFSTFLLSTLSALWLTTCVAENPRFNPDLEGGIGDPCQSAGDCSENLQCAQEICTSGCSEEADCVRGFACVGDVCLPENAVDLSEEGGPCDDDSDCLDGLRCFEDLELNRFCVKLCSVSEEDCPDGQTCVAVEGDAGFCKDLAPDPAPDQAPDQLPDSAPDQTPDQAPEPEPDPEPEPEPDANPDAEPEATDACEDACDNIFRCLELECPEFLGGDNTPDNCVRNCNGDPGFQADAEEIANLSCEQVGQNLCPPETNVGGACEEDQDCGAQGLQAFCFTELDEENEDTGFEGGYCSAVDCESSEECGEGNVCVETSGGRTICLAGCTPRSDECRPGYSCPEIADDFGVCLPRCENDEDCNGRSCDTRLGICQ